MGKGLYKGIPNRFKKGHKFLSSQKEAYVDLKERPVVRLGSTDFQNVVDSDPTGRLVTRDCAGQAIECMILRPKAESGTYYATYDQDPSIPEGDDSTYMFVHKGRTLDLFNQAFKAHSIVSSECTGDLVWDRDSTQQRGLCWSMALKCSVCGYLSTTHKLYDEVRSEGAGRKAATPNVGLQVGLSRQGISTTGLADILQATNTPAPSTRGMQKTANKVNLVIEQANQKDMAERIEKLQVLNAKRGLSHTASIAIEADATYNNRLSSGLGKTPAQPATQATYLACEQVTREKQIISATLYSKLCPCNSEEHRPNCPANLSRDAVIGDEKLFLKNALREIPSNGGPPVGAVTLDGDSSANLAARESGATVNVCTKHLTRRSGKRFKLCAFSQSMFPGRLKSEKDEFHHRFSVDIAHRCQAELQAASETYPGDLTAICHQFRYAPDCIINCYRLCHEHSLVCKKGQPWLRPYVPSSDGHKNSVDTLITPTKGDTKKLKDVLAMRFSTEALEKTFLNRTQNKCEASNRGLAKSLPKHLVFRRNASGRVHAAVHSMNNLPGRSLLKLCEAVGSPLSRKSKVTCQLESKDKITKSHKERQKSPRYKQGRAKRRNETYSRYDAVKSAKCYKTGGFLTEARRTEYKLRAAKRQKGAFTSKVEHAYAKDETL